MVYLDSQIFEILTARRILSSDSLKLVETYRRKWGLDQYDALIQTSLISDEELKVVLAEQLKLPVVDSTDQLQLNKDCLKFVDFKDAKRWWSIPAAYITEGKSQALVLIMSDPTSEELRAEISKKVGANLRPSLATRQEIRTAIYREYPLEQQLPKTFMKR